MDEKLQVDAAILDFLKAFDKITHLRLLYKLEYYEIRELTKLAKLIFSGRS